MSKIIKFIQEGVFNWDEETLRKEIPWEKIIILYGTNNYECNLNHIEKLKNKILEDYPETKNEDIEVRYILHTESRRHARFTMLAVSIDLDEYIRLRNKGEIHIL